MRINIKTTKIELTTDLREYAQTKMDMLEKYLGDISVTNLDMELEHALSKKNSGKNYRAEVNLFVPGDVLRVSKSEKTFNKAIDKVKDHLVLMIKKYKEKKQKKTRIKTI